MERMSITVTYDELSVHGSVSGDWDPDLCTALASRCVAALADAYEVLAHTSARLGVERG